MLGFSYKTVFSFAILFILTISTALLKLLPDIFQPKDFIVYQVWLLGIWIFIMVLPRKVGTILDIPDILPISKK
tara:strand:+ start:295 stop:516 length:222 start_codon:yes stop_codon:yes gene_type:complete